MCFTISLFSALGNCYVPQISCFPELVLLVLFGHRAETREKRQEIMCKGGPALLFLSGGWRRAFL